MAIDKISSRPDVSGTQTTQNNDLGDDIKRGTGIAAAVAGDSFSRDVVNARVDASGGGATGLSTSISAASQGRAARALDALDSDQRAALQQSARRIADAIVGRGESVPAKDLSRVSAALNTESAATVDSILKDGAEIDEQGLEDAANAVMVVAFGEVEGDLGRLAATTKAAVDAKKDIRVTITELREELADADAPWPIEFEWTEYEIDDDGNITKVTQQASLTKAEAEALLSNMELQLDTTSERNEMFQFDLQRAIERQGQLTNTLTAIIKQMHDTMMATIRNIRG